MGRLHRLHDHKKEVQVYDYADLNVPMLERMFNRHCRAYEAVGYKIFLPASAIPGWLSEVPLPVDPKWKADYAATVKRSIRDEVDSPLAKLFVQVASSTILEKDGIIQTRSAIVSSPEITAIDMVTYPHRCGGIDNVLTILADLVKKIDVDKLLQLALNTKEVTWAQRLGYLFDLIKATNLSDILLKSLQNRRVRSRLLIAPPKKSATLEKLAAKLKKK